VQKTAVPGLLVGEKTARWIDRRRRQPQRLKLVEKFLHVIIERARFDQSIDDLPQRKAVLNVFIFRIEQFRRAAKPFDKPFPMVRLIDEDARVAVAALIGLRHRGRLTVTRTLRHFAGDAVARENAQEWIGDQNILQRHIDMLALSRGAPIKERNQGREGCMHGTEMIRHVAWPHERRAPRMAAQIHQPAHGEGNDARCFEIAIRTVQAKTGNRGYNQCRIEIMQCRIAKSILLEITHRFVFDQNIGVAREFAQSLATTFV
jgi:hypothetical protein